MLPLLTRVASATIFTATSFISRYFLHFLPTRQWVWPVAWSSFREKIENRISWAIYQHNHPFIEYLWPVSHGTNWLL